MACNNCGTSSCSCVTSCCTTECNCLGVEDLCLGFGTMEQIRCGKKTLVTKINGEHILLDTNSHNHSNVQEFVEHATESIDTIWDKVKCDQVQILQFDNCDIMENYTGTEECPLVSGQIALVQNPDTECFEWYKYSDISVVTDLPGEACGRFLGSVTTQVKKWVSQKDCLNIPDISANPYITDIVRTDTGYVAYRSDGTQFYMPFPKGKSSKCTFVPATYISDADAEYVLIKVSAVEASGSLGILLLQQDGTVTVTEAGTYSVTATTTHFNQTEPTTCRTTLLCGNVAATNGTSSFFTTNVYNVGDGATIGPFQQAFMSWTGRLEAGEQISLYIDNGTLDLWNDPNYTKIIVSKIGE